MNDFSASPSAQQAGRSVSVAELVAKRYRADGLALPEVEASLLAPILSHRSTRHYRANPLPVSTVELLAAAAQSAPTTSNLQAYSIVAVEDPARKARLAELAAPNRHILVAPLLLLFVADLARLRGVSRAANRTGDGLDYLESFLVAAIDAALAAEAAIIAAEAIGLGTCLIGGMRNHPVEVAAEIGLPAEAVVVFGLTVGVPDLAAGEDVKPRLPQRVVLHRERYAPPAAEELASYDAALRGFQAEQTMPPIDLDRAGRQPHRDGGGGVKGRDRLVQTLRHLGFALK